MTHNEPNYLQVIIVLTVLTIAEVAIVFAPMSRVVVAALLVSLALSKAIIVAAYFMHLKFEKRTLAIIAGTPLILCVLLLVALLPDSNPARNKGEAVHPTGEAPAHSAE